MLVMAAPPALISSNPTEPARRGNQAQARGLQAGLAGRMGRIPRACPSDGRALSHLAEVGLAVGHAGAEVSELGPRLQQLGDGSARWWEAGPGRGCPPQGQAIPMAQGRTWSLPPCGLTLPCAPAFLSRCLLAAQGTSRGHMGVPEGP